MYFISLLGFIIVRAHVQVPLAVTYLGAVLFIVWGGYILAGK